MQKNANRYLSITLHKIQVQVIRDLNINPVKLKLIEQKVGHGLEHTGTKGHFLNITKVAQTDIENY